MKDEERGWAMKLYPGKDVTPHEPKPLDDILLDEDVVRIIKTNHPELLKDGNLMDDEETLRLFFGDERDAKMIASIIDAHK